MCRKYTIYEGFLLSQAVSIGNAVSALKDTVTGDFPAMNFSEICELIQEHKSVSYTHLDVYKRQDWNRDKD